MAHLALRRWLSPWPLLTPIGTKPVKERRRSCQPGVFRWPLLSAKETSFCGSNCGCVMHSQIQIARLGLDREVTKMPGMGQEGDGSRERIEYTRCDGGSRRES